MLVAVTSIVLVLLLAHLHRVIAADRRGRKLNLALHELRRPLQSLSLLVEARRLDRGALGACLDQTRVALGDLDAAINGGAATASMIRLPLAEVTSELECRWRAFGVAVYQPEGEPWVFAEPGRLGAAVDNLVANALTHGSGRVEVRATAGSHGARIEVRDEGPTPARPRRDDPRRGNGLAIAGDTATDFGGSVRGPARARDGGTLATLTLPTVIHEPGR